MVGENFDTLKDYLAGGGGEKEILCMFSWERKRKLEKSVCQCVCSGMGGEVGRRGEVGRKGK